MVKEWKKGDKVEYRTKASRFSPDCQGLTQNWGMNTIVYHGVITSIRSGFASVKTTNRPPHNGKKVARVRVRYLRSLPRGLTVSG